MHLVLSKPNLDHLVILIPGFPVMKAVPNQSFEVGDSFGHQIMATYPGCFTMGGGAVVSKVMPSGTADALPAMAAKKKPGPKPKNKVIE